MVKFLGVFGCLFILGCVSSAENYINSIEDKYKVEYFDVNHELYIEGNNIGIIAYCNGEDQTDILNLTEIIVREGRKGYFDFIMRNDNFCFDSRFLSNIDPLRVQLLKKLWGIKSLEGGKLDVWMLKDNMGQIGYTWLNPAFSKQDSTI